MTSDTALPVEPDLGSRLAWLRTIIALQRTLLASVRTAVSLIGFGFTVAQFFDKLRGGIEGAGHWGVNVPRDMGLLLIAAGVLSLAFSTWQYSQALDHLTKGQFAAFAGDGSDGKSLHKSSYLVAFAVLLIGMVAFIAVLARF